MPLTIAQYQTQYNTDATAYSTAVTNLVNALIALEADARTLANISKGAITPAPFGQDVLGALQDIGLHLGHPAAAPRNSHASLNKRIADQIDAQVKANIANWSGS